MGGRDSVRVRPYASRAGQVPRPYGVGVAARLRYVPIYEALVTVIVNWYVVVYVFPPCVY